MVKNQVVIEFGHGDICVVPTKHKGCGEVGVFLTNVEPGEIGRRVRDFEFDPEKAEVVITFNNIKSVDVLIKDLKALKKMMKEKE